MSIIKPNVSSPWRLHFNRHWRWLPSHWSTGFQEEWWWLCFRFECHVIGYTEVPDESPSQGTAEK